MKYSIYICLIALGLTGCTALGPDYHRPKALKDQPLPEHFSDTSPTNGVVWKPADPAAHRPRGAWWQLFNDAELNRLEDLALKGNQNLVAAAARFEQARNLGAAADSRLFPQLNAGGTPGGDISRQRTSVNAPSQGQPAGTPYTFNTFTAPVCFGWEMDLWGRVRRQSEAAWSRFTASVDDYESARLELATEVAADYFKVQTLAEEYNLVSNTITAYQRSLGLTQNRRRGGIVSDLDVAQAATQLHTAEAQLPDIELRRRQTLHALAILCGRSPIDFSVATNVPTVTIPTIPPSLPSELLEHRPDIAAVERRMAAANAEIGVAKAAFFPSVKINGLAGFQSVNSDSLFKSDSRFWAVGPSLNLPLFTGGLNRANLAAARAAYDEMVAHYRQSVLSAFGEVEDAMAAQHLLAAQGNAVGEAAAAAHKTLEIANHRYTAGLVTYLNVATAETESLNQDRAAVQLKGMQLQASINLIKALGCGWQPIDQESRVRPERTGATTAQGN